MSKHTPGPWTALPNLDVVDAIGCCVAFCSATRGRYESEKPNAMLIAAAPDLLEALQVLASHWPHYASHMEMTRIDRDAIEMARTAIAKATGEQE